MKSSDQPLRILGTPDTMIEAVRLRAENDLGFPIEYRPMDGIAIQRHSIMHPAEFDVVDHWSLTSELLWTANAIQPINVDRVLHWNDLASEVLGRMQSGEGQSPSNIVYVQPDGTLGRHRSDAVSFVPTLFHFDSFGYSPKVREIVGKDEPESWGWFLDPRLSGAVGLTAHAPIAMVEIAMAMRAKNLMSITDLGNLSTREIDAVVDLLIRLKVGNHFAGLWETSDQAVELFEQGILLASVWPKASYRASGPWPAIIQATPIEGSRAWMDGLSISSRTTGERLERAYAYINWWQGGWPGSYFSRSGMYSATARQAEKHLTEDEFSYWYLGTTTRSDIFDNSGRLLVTAGATRDGGHYLEKFASVAVWNTFMNEYNYLVRRWAQFAGPLAKRRTAPQGGSDRAPRHRQPQ